MTIEGDNKEVLSFFIDKTFLFTFDEQTRCERGYFLTNVDKVEILKEFDFR